MTESLADQIDRHRDLLAGFARLRELGLYPTASMTVDEAAALFSGFSGASTRARQQQQLDPPINLLAASGRGEDERIHCALLAWLLDPKGSHFQGAAFLERLVESLGLEIRPELTSARVHTEVASEESRIDIEVFVPGAVLLHLEGKIDAVEGVNQSGREWEDLNSRAGRLGVPAHGRKAIFLTRRGEGARTGGFETRTWLDVADALRPALSLAVSEKVRILVGHVLDCFSSLTTGVS